MKKYNVELSVKVPDVFVRLASDEEAKIEIAIKMPEELAKMVSISAISEELKVSGGSDESVDISKEGRTYTYRLIAELRSRGFNFEHLPHLSRNRVEMMLFGKRNFYRGTEERKADAVRRNWIIDEIGFALGTSFLDSVQSNTFNNIIGKREANTLVRAGVCGLTDLETVRLSELKKIRTCGKVMMEKLKCLAEEGKIKLASETIRDSELD